MKKRFYIITLLFNFLWFFIQPALAQWSSVPFVPPLYNQAMTGVGSKVLIATYQSNHVDIYDINTSQWTTAQLSETRQSSIAAISAGGKALFAGGQINNSLASSRVDIYDEVTNQWSTTQLPEPRSIMAAVSVGSKVLFAGSMNLPFDGTYSSKIDIYDVATNQWSTAQIPARIFVSLLPATTLGNKVIFDLGLELYIYDITTAQWTTRSRPGPGPSYSVITVDNKSFFVNKGEIQILDWTTDQWSTALQPTPRATAKPATVGHLAIFGGGQVDPYGYGTNAVDIYNAATNQWSVSQLPQAENATRATSVGNKAFFLGVNALDIYTVDAALPVNLIAFTGSYTEGIGTALSWQTSLEINNDHFEIQRSDNAKGFETIGRVQGKGTTQARTEYSFTDADTPKQITYYRLKQVDLDGSTHLSNIISVNRRESKPQPGSITLGPVPTSGTLTLQLSAGKTIRELSVHDLHGRRLVSQTGSHTTTDVSVLPAGVYLLNVMTTDGQRLNTRFVKQ